MDPPFNTVNVTAYVAAMIDATVAIVLIGCSDTAYVSK